MATYGRELLEADRKRLNNTSSIGLGETQFVKAGARSYRDWATTVADVKDHQVIDILPSGSFVDVATWLDRQRTAWREYALSGALDVGHLRGRAPKRHPSAFSMRARPPTSF